MLNPVSSTYTSPRLVRPTHLCTRPRRVLADPDLQVDQWKIYPCEVVPWTVIKKWCAKPREVALSLFACSAATLICCFSQSMRHM